MLFSKDVLFVHVPKTGGMSVTRYLLEVLPRPVYYFHDAIDASITDAGVMQIPGMRHASLEEAEKIVREYGYDIHDFPLILAVLRNPYALEVSRYAYVQKEYPWNKGLNHHLAVNEDFETFAVESRDHAGSSRPLKSYFLLNGKLPRNLRIIKLENLAEGLKEALREVGINKTADLAWVNKSKHNHFMSYYTQSAEMAVYQRYKWVFDHGFYKRIDPSNFAFAEGGYPYSYELPVVGPVRLIGPAYGLWADSWAGDRLRFEVEVEQPITKIAIRGTLSHEFGTKAKFVLSVDGKRTAASFESGKSFTWETPCSIGPGTPVTVKLTTSASPYSREAVSPENDGRAFLLSQISFEPDPVAEVIREVTPPKSAVFLVEEGGRLRKLEEQQGWYLVSDTSGGWEKLFAGGAKGSKEVKWIRPNATYEFRLYAGKEHEVLLDSVEVKRSEGAFITASPNPVPAGEGLLGETTISWSVGEEGSWAQVYVSRDGGPEKLFAGGAKGSKEVKWIRPNATYEFRLYAGKEHEVLLDSVEVKRSEGAFITASPNPVPAGEGLLGETTISWSVGEEGSWAQVYVSVVEGEAGYPPSDSAEAIAQLEALREKGAEFLVLPATAFWWLEHYPEFEEHLERCYREAADQEDTCLVFDLREPRAAVSRE